MTFELNENEIDLEWLHFMTAKKNHLFLKSFFFLLDFLVNRKRHFIRIHFNWFQFVDSILDNFESNLWESKYSLIVINRNSFEVSLDSSSAISDRIALVSVDFVFLFVHILLTYYVLLIITRRIGLLPC